MCDSEETEEDELAQKLEILKESRPPTPAMGFWEVQMKCV